MANLVDLWEEFHFLLITTQHRQKQQRPHNYICPDIQEKVERLLDKGGEWVRKVFDEIILISQKHNNYHGAIQALVVCTLAKNHRQGAFLILSKVCNIPTKLYLFYALVNNVSKERGIEKVCTDENGSAVVECILSWGKEDSIKLLYYATKMKNRYTVSLETVRSY